MPRKRRIITDFDDVLTNMVQKLVKVYNDESGDNISIDAITSWNIEDFVLPEWKDKIRDYFNRPGWFRDVCPREDAIEVTKKIIEDGDELFIASAYVAVSCNDKYEYLKEFFPFINSRNLIFINHKHLIDADYLIDDGEHNLLEFVGTPIVFDKPWNKSCVKTKYGRTIPRAKDWHDVYRIINSK